jgi:diguanylate cyclase (GGDEF)-like protein
MPAKSLNLDDFPGSPYAEELRGKPVRTLFVAALEEEYAASHVQRVRRRVRIWFTVALIVTALFTVGQIQRAGISNPVTLIYLTSLLPCTAALVWLAWSRRFESLYLFAAPCLVGVFSTLIALLIALAIAAGRDEQLAALTVDLIAIFFFAGLMYRQALWISTITFVVFVISSVVAKTPEFLLLKSVVAIALTSGMAAIVYRDVEQSYRRHFLEGALVRELMARDGLSGLANRRAFDEHLLRVWHQAQRDRRPLALLMIDIDYFKRYNDDYGHQAGDEALRAVATVIQGFARRPLDLAARYGGEEFAVILYDLELQHVQMLAEELRENVQKVNLTSAEAAALKRRAVTVSVGVGLATPMIGRTPNGAIQLADEALYEAKDAGRNRVIIKGVEAYMLLLTGSFKSHRKLST